MRIELSSARTLAVAENRLALSALEEFGDALVGGANGAANLLFLHGPPGTGKTHLLDALVAAIQRQAARVSVSRLSASEFVVSDSIVEILDPAQSADLLIIEDLQHLPLSFVEALIQVLDNRSAEGISTLFSAATGPKDLRHRGVLFPTRLTSRLAAGLVVALKPLSAVSRLFVLENWIRTRRLTVEREALVWIAENFATWRQLEGAVSQLQVLAAEGILTCSAVVEHFGVAKETRTLTVERITEHVGAYFELSPRRLKSSGRARHILLPRQISMYLARRLTNLSLEQIGEYFGGRDHSTVLHACAKVESVLERSVEFEGTVRELEAELS